MNAEKLCYTLMICLVLVLAMPALATVDLNEADSGKAVTLQVGEALEFNLAANPTTGYMWTYTSNIDPGILPEEIRDYRPASKLIGAGGMERWVFRAAKPGYTSINLAYLRPWESAKPTRTFTLYVTVKAPPPLAGESHNLAALANRLVVCTPGSKTYYVDYYAHGMVVAPFAEGGRLYAPTRYLLAALGVPAERIDWNLEAREILIDYPGSDTTYLFYPGTTGIFARKGEGEPRLAGTMTAAPIYRDDRTYLPLRDVARFFGYEVGWDEKTGSALIGPPGLLPRLP